MNGFAGGPLLVGGPAWGIPPPSKSGHVPPCEANKCVHY